MAGKSIAAKQCIGSKTPITKEEESLLVMYRRISRWERNSFLLILQSLVCGQLNHETDKMTWNKLCRITGLPRDRKAVSHV